MGPIMELARKHNILHRRLRPGLHGQSQWPVRRHLGTISCFSTQQGKHMTTEKAAWSSQRRRPCPPLLPPNQQSLGYGDAKPDHYFAALNYRMCELQSAVALAQLEKLESVADRRVKAANKLPNAGRDPGIKTPPVAAGDVHTYWKYCLTVDGSVLKMERSVSPEN